MAVTLNSRIAVEILGELANATDLSAGGPVPVRLPLTNVLRTGTGANQADRIFADSGNIVASGTTSLDLAGGGLTDPLGAALTFAKLKVIAVAARSTNNAANNVVVTRPASNGVPWASAAGDSVALSPGGIFLLTHPGAGWTVTGGTADLIDLVNSAGTNAVDYDVVLIGTSA